MPLQNRRQFLSSSAALAVSSTGFLARAADSPPKWRGAIIGHTGRGGFGHGLELVFRDRPEVSAVTLADPDEALRLKTGQSVGAIRTYGDYRELLRTEKPDLVSVGMRHADQHYAVCKAALEIGAHIYCEKPFVTSSQEADELLKLAATKNRRIAVAHTMRMAPAVQALRRWIQAGNLGELIQVRAHGKQDSRAGGEDLMVLGTHLLDLLRLFLGDPHSCTARIRWRGQEMTTADRRQVKDNVGWVAGDDVEAQFDFPNRVTATFTSNGRLQPVLGPWGLEFLGSRGSARFNADINPTVFVQKPSSWTASGRSQNWTPLPMEPHTELRNDNHNRVPVDDWLAAIRENREPECSGRNAAWAIEMVMAVYRSALLGRRVEFPLAERSHPLE